MKKCLIKCIWSSPFGFCTKPINLVCRKGNNTGEELMEYRNMLRRVKGLSADNERCWMMSDDIERYPTTTINSQHTTINSQPTTKEKEKPPVTPGKGGLPTRTQAEADAEADAEAEAEAEEMCTIGQLLGAVNILLIEAYEFGKHRNLNGIMAGMNIFLDRTGLKKQWVSVIPEGLDHPLFEFASSAEGGSDED